jgi:hypothetical protein
MAIQIHGVYEYDSGRKDYVHQCQEVYRIYVYKKIRKYYRCLINQVGTDFIIHENVNGKWLRESCKYLGPARNTWEDLFQEVGGNGI